MPARAGAGAICNLSPGNVAGCSAEHDQPPDGASVSDPARSDAPVISAGSETAPVPPSIQK
jgi:hypothetical protein